MKIKNLVFFSLLMISKLGYSQEGIAVYTDYLTDNYYLIHPSMAGASNCAKVRVTARNQWFGVEDAPALQTGSFNTSLDQDGKYGVGAIVFNDRNGYHSQTGLKLTYAQHFLFSRTKADLNMLSFGLSGAIIQSRLDESKFTNGPFDPIIVGGGFTQKDQYFNLDFGTSYHYLNFYVHGTVKNLISNQRREIYSPGIESDNLRKFLISSGYVFGNEENLSIEPSLMYQLTEKTGESSIDINAKVYKGMNFGKLWGGLGYRRSFDGAEYRQGTVTNTQKLQYVTPFIGVNYKTLMFAYTYNHLLGDVKFDNQGFHQITLGLNLWCKPKKFECNCPAVN